MMDENDTTVVNKRDDTENGSQLDGGRKVATSSNSEATREICKYGNDCYRLNAEHKEIFSHPGDSDYHEPPSNNEDNNKPECKYGTSCYRKNPQHIRDFGHTAPPKKTRKKKSPKNVKNEDEEGSVSSNDYDYDDPFINDDDSSDDYEPTNSESDSDYDKEDDEEEDERRMIKEAKRFLRSKEKE